MTFSEIVTIATSIIVSVGGSGVIIFALSSWLGKIWAQRIMDKERHAFQTDLEKLKADLSKENSNEIESLKHDLALFKERHLREFNDKLQIYRIVIDLIAEIIGDFDKALIHNTNQRITPERLDQFNRMRLKVYGNLAMLAPQSVMDAQDKMMDYLLMVANKNAEYHWETVRTFALALLNAMRKDLALNNSEISYNGEL